MQNSKSLRGEPPLGESPTPTFLITIEIASATPTPEIGSIPGWSIVENQTYHDLCWVQATDLQIEPGTSPK